MSFNVHPRTLKEIAQTLQQTKVHARSVVNAAEALMPLADDTELEYLTRIKQNSSNSVSMLNELYDKIASKAFGPESSQ